MARVTGGDKIKAKLQAMAKNVGTATTVRVGFLAGSTYPNGTSTPMVAAIQEFGAPRAGIPPRPFFRNMIAARSSGWPAALEALLVQTDYDTAKSLTMMGEGIKGQLEQSIIATNDPPLSPVTLMLRKMFGNDHSQIRARDVAEARRRVAAGESTAGASPKPLVWTGHLLDSVGYEVK